MSQEPRAVSEEEAALFGELVYGAIKEWLDRTGRDRIPEEVAERALKSMDEGLNQ